MSFLLLWKNVRKARLRGYEEYPGRLAEAIVATLFVPSLLLSCTTRTPSNRKGLPNYFLRTFLPGKHYLHIQAEGERCCEGTHHPLPSASLTCEDLARDSLNYSH